MKKNKSRSKEIYVYNATGIEFTEISQGKVCYIKKYEVCRL